MKIPPLPQQSIEHVDATPDVGYPLRILKAYRENCNVKWVVEGLDEATKQVYETMNKHQDRRAAILNDAIRLLEAATDLDDAIKTLEAVG